MSMFIDPDECISCGECEPECARSAIREGAMAFEIDTAKCTECAGEADEPQCAESCPVGCIHPLEAA